MSVTIIRTVKVLRNGEDVSDQFGALPADAGPLLTARLGDWICFDDGDERVEFVSTHVGKNAHSWTAVTE